MPDDISQAEPEEVITPEAEVQETDTEEVITPEEPQKEKPLTLEDYRAIAREEARREAQSQVARSESRTNKRIQERIAGVQANKQILNLSDEQVQQAQDKIIEEERKKSYRESYEPEASGSEEQAPEFDPIRQLNTVIDAVFKTVGTTVTPNDPESEKLQAVIDKAWTIDGPEGLAMVQIAAADFARAKAARLEAQRKNAAARVVGGGEQTNTKGAIGSDVTGHELFTRAHKK